MENGITTLSKDDLLCLHHLLCRVGGINLALEQMRGHVFGVELLGTRMEAVSAVPMFALYKKGILFESDVNGDHRTQLGVMAGKDLVTIEKNGHNHVREIFRNHFSKATGGNRGRDGNVHLGCLACNIVPFMYSDMGGMAGIMAGRAERLVQQWNDTPHDLRPVAISFYGDGAEQQGLLHETRNAVAVSNFKWTLEEFIRRYGEQFITPLMRESGVSRGAPYIFIIVRNKRSLFADAIEEYANSNLAKRALGYGDMTGVSIDSDDIQRYYTECVLAIDRAQKCISTLMVVDTYRGTGHNQSMIQFAGPIHSRKDMANVTRVFGYPRNTDGSYDLSEFNDAWKNDPILNPKYILDIKVADEETLTRIQEEEEASVKALAVEVLQEPDITVDEDKKDRNIFPPLDTASLPKEPSSMRTESALKLGYNEAYTWKIGQIMRADKDVIYYGEDVGSREGGVLSLTRGRRDKLSLAEEFGPGRIPNFPLSEEAGLSMVAGHSLSGPKGFWENQFGWFFADSYRVLDGTAVQYYQKKMRFRYISVFPCGKVHGGGSGDYHERYVEGILLTMGGIVIVFASNAYDLAGLLHTAYLYDGPVALILEISAANSSEFMHLAKNWATGELNPALPQGVPPDPYAIPFGKAKIVREGKDFTVVAYGACAVAAAKNEADFLYNETGIDVEVIDLRTAHPTDFEAIKKSAAKTGRFLLMQSANEFRGAGHYIKSKLLDDDEFMESILTRKIPLICAGMEGDIFVPTAKVLLEARLPWYETEVPAVDDAGKKYSQRIHRSAKLAAHIREGMNWK